MTSFISSRCAKEQWIPSEEMKDVTTYVTTLHQRMLDAQKIMRKNLKQEHLKQEQQKQKTWYEKKARTLNINERDQVILLLPDTSAEFTRKWQGPLNI